MKNARMALLVLTCIFAAFLTGLFIGRNQNPEPVQVSAIPAATVATAAPAKESPANSSTEPIGTEPIIININTATSEQLQTLPSIGPEIAGRIVAYRNEHGSFHSTTELLNVSGIGEKRLETILDLVTTGG